VVASISQDHVKDLFFFSSRERKCRTDESKEPSSFCFSSVLFTRSPSSHLPFHKPNVRKYYKALPAAVQLRIWKWCGFRVLAERARGRVCTAIERSMLRYCVRDYIRPHMRKFSWMMMSFTAAITNLICMVSVAHVKWV
jgi:hypothetical protein